jgi:4-hydroxy-tetrahydrodipicolinate synthase
LTKTKNYSAEVISLTPFDIHGRLDEEGLRGHLRRMRDAGVGVYVGGSGSGEGHALSLSEARRVMEIARDELQGRVPVRAMGTEPRTANQMIEYAQIVAEVGLDGMQIYPVEMGHGVIPSEEEIETYYVDVLEQVRMPVAISTHFFSGYLVPLPVLRRLVERFDNVIGINSTSNQDYMQELIDLLGSKVEIHVGMLTLPALVLGANGYMTSEGNLAPKLCQSVISHHASGQLDLRDAAFAKVTRLWQVCHKYGAIRGTKLALQLLRLPGGYPRRPRLQTVPDSAISEILKQLHDLDIAQLEGWKLPEVATAG